MTTTAQQFAQEADRTRRVLATKGCFKESDPVLAVARRLIDRGQRRTSNSTHMSEMRPGEVLMKQWVYEQGKRLGIAPQTVWMRLYRGLAPWPTTMRKVSTRRIYVQQSEVMAPIESKRGQFMAAHWRTQRS